MSERGLNIEDEKRFDEIYDYIKNYKLNQLRKELNEFKTNSNQIEGVLKDFNLIEKLKQTEKMSEYESEGERYSNFYNRVLKRVYQHEIKSESHRKNIIKEELIKLKQEVELDNSIELTSNEIEELIIILEDITRNEAKESLILAKEKRIKELDDEISWQYKWFK